MDLLCFFKGMKISHTGSGQLVFRTSRLGRLIGVIFILTGLVQCYEVVSGNRYVWSFWSVGVAFFVAGIALLAAGSIICTYRRRVFINQESACIEYAESSIFGSRVEYCHFQDILHLELCSLTECVFASRTSMWTLKVYIRSKDGFKCARLFASMDYEMALEASESLAAMTGKAFHVAGRPLRSVLSDQVSA